MAEISLSEQLAKQREEMEKIDREMRSNNLLKNPQNNLADAIQGGGYKVPTLTERIEQLEKKVNHLERLIGIK